MGIDYSMRYLVLVRTKKLSIIFSRSFQFSPPGSETFTEIYVNATSPEEVQSSVQRREPGRSVPPLPLFDIGNLDWDRVNLFRCQRSEWRTAIVKPSRRFFLYVTAKTKAHCGEQFVLVVGLASRREAFIECRG